MKKRGMIVAILMLLILCNNDLHGKASEISNGEAELINNSTNIVVIHSYNLEYQWTYNQNVGIRNVILETYPEANIYTEFLDWKRFPEESIILGKAEEFRDKYKEMDIDLLLVTDDRALEFAIAYREEIFHNAPIVFGGIIDTTAAEIIGDAENITGVYENMQPEGAIHLLQALQPEVNHLILIHDLSESGIRTNDTFINALYSLQLEDKYTITDWSEKTYDELLYDVSTLDTKTAIIFISYAISSDGVVKQPQTFCKEFAAVSSVPMYSIDEHQFGYGIIGGTFLSGVLQGEAIANQGIRILKGECADTIAPIKEATVYSGVDDKYIKKYNIDKSVLDSNVVILNEKENFYEQNPILVHASLSIFIFLIILIGFLLWVQGRLKKSRAQILNSKNQLQSMNEELQAGEEELIAQNEELEEMQAKLEYENRHDLLTGLYNRNALEEYVNRKLLELNTENKTMIVFIDLDNFKFINNTYGHHFGDQLLIRVAKRLEIIDENFFVSRIGGDEFVLVKIFSGLEDLAGLNCFLLRISKSIIKKYEIEGQHVSITASIGYSIYPDNGNTFEQLLIEADVAMYNAKKDGKSALKKYVNGMNDVYQNEYLLVRKVKEGLDKNAFYVQYQPIVKSDGSEVVSFEALIRWKDEELGAVSPLQFIPLAESSGLILPIGELVCHKVMEFYMELKKFGYDKIKLSINVSIVQFYQKQFVEDLVKLTKECGIDPKYIQLEITESVMIETYDYIVEKLNELKKHGFQIALDDFGTGFSSLAYLQKLPIDVIKIDKTFTDQIYDLRGATLVDATISIAKRFGITTIAEGVETKEQVDYLIDKKCDLIQGFYYSKPLMAKDAIQFVIDRNQK